MITNYSEVTPSGTFQGFKLTFANNITISVAFGSGTYCSNRNVKPCPSHSENCEIAIYTGQGTPNPYMIVFGDDSVKGYVDANTLAQIISLCSLADNIQALQQALENAGLSKPY